MARLLEFGDDHLHFHKLPFYSTKLEKLELTGRNEEDCSDIDSLNSALEPHARCNAWVDQYPEQALKCDESEVTKNRVLSLYVQVAHHNENVQRFCVPLVHSDGQCVPTRRQIQQALPLYAPQAPPTIRSCSS